MEAQEHPTSRRRSPPFLHDREASYRRMSARCEYIQTRAIHLCLEGARIACDAVIGVNHGRFAGSLPRVRTGVPTPLPSTTATGLRLRASSSLFRPPYTPARTQAPWCRPSANPGLFNPWHPCWLRFAPKQDTLGLSRHSLVLDKRSVLCRA